MATACFALWCQILAPAAWAQDEQGASAPQKNGPFDPDAWAAGLEAVSIAMPASAASSASAVESPVAAKETGGEFFAVPIPRVDPALGTGLAGTAAYLFKFDPNDEKTPSSVIGATALWMDSGSWAAGIGGKLYLMQDRFRLAAGLLYADLRYDLTVTPSSPGSETKVPLDQVAYGALVEPQIRVAPNLYLGLRVLLGKISATLRSENISDLPPAVADNLGHIFALNSVGPSIAYDTRDNSYYPRKGIAVDVRANIYTRAIDSDANYKTYELNYRQYLTVRERDVLAWQAYLCDTGGDPPFFLQCQVGQNSILRGVVFGQYRGNAMAAVQAEYRWQVLPRWILAAFGGVAQVGSSFSHFTAGENLYAGGVGVRFVVEPTNGVTVRVDYGVGKDQGALYVGVGEAF